MKSRFNHYDALGVAPTATADDIARAFASQGSALRPHAFGGLAEICLAYETLRDPIKRRAYDASIGIRPEPDPPKPAMNWPKPHPVLAGGSAKPPAPPGTQDDIPAFLARPAAKPEPHVGRGGPPPPIWEARLASDLRPIDWKRTGSVLGGVIGAACLVGGFAGWWSASAISETPQAEEPAPPPLPPANSLATSDASTIAATPAPEARIERPRRAIAATRRIERPRTVSKTAEVEQPSQDSLTEREPVPSEPGEAEAPAVATAAAAMPLPNRVVARTIERIGYSCGQVVSTVPAEGGVGGTYTVTCSSGQSYRASPVNGRYRFKRLGSR